MLASSVSRSVPVWLALGWCVLGHQLHIVFGHRSVVHASFTELLGTEEHKALSDSFVDVTSIDDLRAELNATVSTPAANAVAESLILRGCLMELAAAYTKLIKPLLHSMRLNSRHAKAMGIHNPSYDTWEAAVDVQVPLEELLEQFFVAQDTSGFLDKRQKAQDVISKWHFSPSEAEAKCEARKNGISKDVLQECLLKYANAGQTMVSSSCLFTGCLASVERKDLQLADEAKKDLAASLQRKWLLEEQLDTISLVEGQTFGERTSVKMQMLLGNMMASGGRSDNYQHQDTIHDLVEPRAKELGASINRYRSQILDNYGFDEAYTRIQCQQDHKKDDMSAGARLLERLVKEIIDPVAAQGPSGCEEVEGKYCPEGTHPQLARSIDHKTFASVWTTLFLAEKPLMFAVGSLVTLLTGNPMVAALATIPGTGFVLAFPIATLAAMDWVAKCTCGAASCEFDETLQVCAIRKGSNSNPFGRLPSPGQKCVPKDVTDGAMAGNASGQERCMLTVCVAKDFETGLASETWDGTVGFKDHGTYNCLVGKENTDGQASPQHLLLMDEIRVGGDKPEDNSQTSRTKLYMSLGLPEASLFGGLASTVSAAAAWSDDALPADYEDEDYAAWAGAEVGTDHGSR